MGETTCVVELIVCCGMKRSGSTLQFNMVQEILRHAARDFENLKYIQGDRLADVIEDAKTSQTALFKCHDLPEVIALDAPKKLLLYTVRDPRDAYLSCKNKWGKGPGQLPELMAKFASNYQLARNVDHILIQRYEDFFGQEQKAIREIATFLGIDIDATAASAIADRLSIQAAKPPTWAGGVIALAIAFALIPNVQNCSGICCGQSGRPIRLSSAV